MHRRQVANEFADLGWFGKTPDRHDLLDEGATSGIVDEARTWKICLAIQIIGGNCIDRYAVWGKFQAQ